MTVGVSTPRRVWQIPPPVPGTMAIVLIDRITDEIEASGPMPFERFMELALYSPDGGYFTSDRLRSEAAGDFLTSPEVSPLFGETIAGFVESERARIGRPFTVVESGAGSGSLLRPLLDALRAPPDRVAVIEVSPAARKRAAAVVPEAEVAEALGDLTSPCRGVVIANELLDNLPAALAVRSGGGWMERMIGLKGAELTIVHVAARPEIGRWADAHAGPVPEGGVVEVQLAAGAWLGSTLEWLEAGAVVIFDYGDVAHNLEHRRPEGTVRTYRSHHLGPDPLAEPGATDITMDLNFSALVAVAERAGAETTLTRQDDFLGEWGLRGRLSELRYRELAAARAGDDMLRLELKSVVTGAEALLHPRGLGDFRVLVARV